MTKHYLLSGLLLSSMWLGAQTTIFSEDFSTCQGTYAEFGAHTDGSSDFFIRTDGIDQDTSCIAASTFGTIAYASVSGDYYEAEDTDSPDNPNRAGGAFGSGANSVGVHFTGIDVSAYTNVEIDIDLAASSSATFELSDYLNIYVDPTQSGSYTLIGSFHANTSVFNRPLLEDTDFDGEGEGNQLVETFTTYTFSVPSSATTMNVRIELWSAGGSQNMAFDEFTVKGDLASTTWNGTTWSGGVPDANTDAVIAGNGAPGNFTCKNLTINNGFSLVFGSNQTVTVSGSSVVNNGFGFFGTDRTAEVIFDNDGNTVTLSGNSHSFEGIVNVSGTTTLVTGGLLTLGAASASSYGQLTGTGTVSGNVTAQAFVNASSGRYAYLGSPFTNVSLSDFNEPGAIMVSANTAQGTCWEWDASNASWTAAGNANLASTADRGTAYAMFAGSNGSYGPFLIDDLDGTGTISISGTINNDATVSKALSYNNGQSSSVNFIGGSSINSTEGWNLVANPYLSVYDWDGQSIPTDMSAAYYYSDGTNYFVYAKGAGTAPRYIAPFQGFFVQLTENTPGNLVFDRNNRTPDQSSSLSKTNSYTLDGINLHINSADGQRFDDLYIGYDANATTGFDREWDAHKLLNSAPAPNFYTQFGQEDYAICRVPYNGLSSFPLFLEQVNDGELMEISMQDKGLQAYQVVELEDLKEGIRHDLKQSTYTFNHDTSYNTNRFVLHFSQNAVGRQENAWINAYAYGVDNGIQLHTGTSQPVDVEVYNLAGQLVYKATVKQNTKRLSISKQGLFIVKLQEKSTSKTIKVLR
jgi:hypothetical protein